MVDSDDFDRVRSTRPGLDELRLIRERAIDEAAGIIIKKSSSAWQERASLWENLATAAYACEGDIIRESIWNVTGPPNALGGKGSGL